MGLLGRLFNMKHEAPCPVCGGPAVGWTRDCVWLCRAREDHGGMMSADGRFLTMSGFIEETVMPDPEIRAVSRQLNDRRFAEASERFRRAVSEGVELRVEIFEAAEGVAAWAAEQRSEGARFHAAFQAVLAGYVWRCSEREGRPYSKANPSPAIDVRLLPDEPVAAFLYRELRREDPSDDVLVTLATAASEAVARGAPFHQHSPGSSGSGREFLANGLAEARGVAFESGAIESSAFQKLFLTGVALRDAEYELEPTSPAIPVAVGFSRFEVTPVRAIDGPGEGWSFKHPGTDQAPSTEFCTECGSPAGTGRFCGHCGGQLRP